MKKVFFLSLMCFMAIAMNAQKYVDLGLSSGTKWKSANEKGFYSYDLAIRNFGSSLPTQEQWMELKNECEWTWTGMGYKVVGSNGNHISLPVVGSRHCNGNVLNVGSYGDYWSSTPIDSDDAWYLHFSSGRVYMSNLNRCYGQSVRLVQD